jgi:hypothetical protein
MAAKATTMTLIVIVTTSSTSVKPLDRRSLPA